MKLVYLYCYANIHRLVPCYRKIGIFPQRLEGFDNLPIMDINWLVRLLDQAMIMLLDIYVPCENPKLRQTIGYSEDMYLEALE